SLNRLSQNRSTCCGTFRSAATSLMVRNASGAFSTAGLLLYEGLSTFTVYGIAFQIDFGRVVRIDPLLQNRGRLEHHHSPRRNRHFLASLGISADSLALLANHERAERRQFTGLSSF